MVPISKVGRILEAENSMWRMAPSSASPLPVFPIAFWLLGRCMTTSNWKLVLGGPFAQLRDSDSQPYLSEETTTIRWGGRFKDDGTKDVIGAFGRRAVLGYQIEIDPTNVPGVGLYMRRAVVVFCIRLGKTKSLKRLSSLSSGTIFGSSPMATIFKLG